MIRRHAVTEQSLQRQRQIIRQQPANNPSLHATAAAAAHASYHVVGAEDMLSRKLCMWLFAQPKPKPTTHES